MGNKAIYSPWYDTLQQLKSEIFKGLRVCVPGSISAINVSDGTVDVSIGLMQNIAQPNPPMSLDISYPTLPHCPVFTLQGGGVGAVMPIKINDECLVIFSDRALDNWFSTGEAMPLPSLRMHDISDGIVLVGLNSLSDILKTPLSVGEGGICETSNLVGAKVAINPATHLVTVANSTQNLSTILHLLLTTLTTLNTTLAAMTTGSIAAGTTQTTIGTLTAAFATITADLTALLY